MKTIITFLLALVFFSCEKSEGIEATVVKDCTGSYLRINNEDWRVCNRSALNKFEDGQVVKATFSNLTECDNNEIVCLMFHPSAGNIKVSRITKP